MSVSFACPDRFLAIVVPRPLGRLPVEANGDSIGTYGVGNARTQGVVIARGAGWQLPVYNRRALRITVRTADPSPGVVNARARRGGKCPCGSYRVAIATRPSRYSEPYRRSMWASLDVRVFLEPWTLTMRCSCGREREASLPDLARSGLRDREQRTLGKLVQRLQCQDCGRVLRSTGVLGSGGGAKRAEWLVRGRTVEPASVSKLQQPLLLRRRVRRGNRGTSC